MRTTLLDCSSNNGVLSITVSDLMDVIKSDDYDEFLMEFQIYITNPSNYLGSIPSLKV